ncbi:MAG: DUF4010 domain-containing protein [Promethearchaeota archaeon]
METLDLLFYSDVITILISFLCGFLLGIERTRKAAPFDVRDHVFVSVIATVLVLLNERFSIPFGYVLIYLFFGGIIAFLLIGSLRHRTTTLSMMLALITGIVVYYYYSIAITISVIFLIVLSTKKQFGKIQGLSSIEWTGTVEFIAIVLLLYILIPDYVIIAGINIKSIIIIFITILAIKYFSYFLLKSSVESTVYYLAFFGGLAHSEATTIELSEAGASPSSIWLLIQTMMVRMLLILLIAPVLFIYALGPIIITSLIGIIGSFLILRKNLTKFTIEKLKNPLSIKSAIIFSGTYSLAVIVSIILEFVKLNLFVYYIITFLIGLISGGASAVFVVSAYLGGLLNEAHGLVMLSIGLSGAILNKIFYVIKFLNKQEGYKRYYFELLLYQTITIFSLLSLTFLNVYIQKLYF